MRARAPNALSGAMAGLSGRFETVWFNPGAEPGRGLDASAAQPIDCNPMNAKVDEAMRSALLLPAGERPALIDSRQDRPGGIEKTAGAKEEIRRRNSDLLSGATQAVPWGEARTRLNAL